MNFKTMNIQDIIAWCKANNQVEWLKAEAKKQMPCKVYPRVEKDGKMVVDKSQNPTTEYRPITFIQIKMDFVNTFMPEIAPKKQAKKPTFYELIDNL